MTHYSAYSVFRHALRGNKTWSRAWCDPERPALVGLEKNRKGEVIRVIDFVGNETWKAKVPSHHFFDPEGERQND